MFYLTSVTISLKLDNLVIFVSNLALMKVTIITPMEIESEKVKIALQKIVASKHEYSIVISGIGREAIAKTMLHLTKSDCVVLVGFGGIVGKNNQMPSNLKLGCAVEITKSGLFGYEGLQFENGKPITTNGRTSLPNLISVTSDKFVRTTSLAEKTIINMEDYTFMYLKREQDFIIRIISDFLPHETEIDFFEEVKQIDFLPAILAIENALN